MEQGSWGREFQRWWTMEDKAFPWIPANWISPKGGTKKMPSPSDYKSLTEICNERWSTKYWGPGVGPNPKGQIPEIGPGHIGCWDSVWGSSPWSRNNDWEQSAPDHSAGREGGEEGNITHLLASLACHHALKASNNGNHEEGGKATHKGENCPHLCGSLHPVLRAEWSYSQGWGQPPPSSVHLLLAFRASCVGMWEKGKGRFF